MVPTRAGDERDGDADDDRDPAAVEDAAVQVAVEVVGAEPGLGARRRVDVRRRRLRQPLRLAVARGDARGTGTPAR